MVSHDLLDMIHLCGPEGVMWGQTIDCLWFVFFDARVLQRKEDWNKKSSNNEMKWTNILIIVFKTERHISYCSGNSALNNVQVLFICLFIVLCMVVQAATMTRTTRKTLQSSSSQNARSIECPLSLPYNIVSICLNFLWLVASLITGTSTETVLLV